MDHGRLAERRSISSPTRLRDIADKHGGAALGALVSPHSTLEEMALAARLVRGLGSDNIDFRLRQTDFRGDGQGAGIPWLGLPVAELNTLGSRAGRRQLPAQGSPADRAAAAAGGEEGRAGVDAACGGRRLAAAASRMRSSPHRRCCRPRWPRSWSRPPAAPAQPVPAALAGIEPVGPRRRRSPRASPRASARRSCSATSPSSIPDASQLLALAQALAGITGATLGCLTEAANSVGGYVAGALPQSGGLDARAMLDDPRRAYVVLHAEPAFDCANPVAARAALDEAEFVAVLSPFRHGAEYADVLLPIGPFTETAGTFVNCEGRAQRFNGVVTPLGRHASRVEGAARAGVAAGFAGLRLRDDRRGPRDACRSTDADIAARLGNGTRVAIATPRGAPGGLERVADVPIHFADPLARRAPALQETADAAPPRARMNAAMLQQLGVAAGDAGPGPAGPRRGRADGGGGRRGARRRRPHRGGASVDVRARRPVRPDRDEVAAGSMMDTRRRIARRPVLRPRVARGVDAAEDRRDRDPADPRRRVPHARRAQDHRLDAGAHRPESRRPVRPAAAVRRRLQADLQGNRRPVGREPLPVLHRADAGAGARAGRVGGRFRSATRWCCRTSTPGCCTCSR